MEKNKDSMYDKFGIDKETFDKSKDILPTFKLGEIGIGSSVHLQFLESEPRIIEVADKFSKNPDEKKETHIINVYVDKVVRIEDDGNSIDVPIGKKYSLFLSSTSLKLGVMKVYSATKDLNGAKALIEIDTTTYKKFGENRVYNVAQI